MIDLSLSNVMLGRLILSAVLLRRSAVQSPSACGRKSVQVRFRRRHIQLILLSFFSLLVKFKSAFVDIIIAYFRTYGKEVFVEYGYSVALI